MQQGIWQLDYSTMSLVHRVVIWTSEKKFEPGKQNKFEKALGAHVALVIRN